MADRKPTSRYYSNLGGVNLKNSEYTLEQTQFLDLRNLDFDVPNALQKRPGSTQAVAVGTSGPIIGLFEYKQLTGASYIVAGTDTALFYLAANAYTLLDTGWTNGQPQDFLTFVNKMWVASGQKFRSWDAATFGLQNYGLPCPRFIGPSLPIGVQSEIFATSTSSSGSSNFLVGGAGVNTVAASFVARGVYVAYSYVRQDGYQGPTDFFNAKNIIRSDTPSNGSEFFGTWPNLFGLTAPSGQGITAINIWVATDTVTAGSTLTTIMGASGVEGANVGAMGYVNTNTNLGAFRYMSITMLPNADLSRFHLYKTIPISQLFTGAPSGVLGSYWGTTFGPMTFTSWEGVATGSQAFTGTPFCYFDTYTPKYIDVNQNVMFMSGFSNAPSVMTFSEIGQPEITKPDYNFEVRTNDGDRIMGHKTYNGNVIVFKEESFHKVIGSTPEDFQLVELSTEFGCLSNNTIIEFNEKLLFLDRKGIVRFDGSGWQVISDGIDEVFRRMNLSAARENACAVHHNYRNQVWFGIPVDGATKNNLTVVYDYLIDAWTFFDGYDASAYSFVKGALTKPTVWRGSYSGIIYYTGESFFGDNGQGITAMAYSRFEQFQGENATNVWRRLFLDVATAPNGASGAIQGQVFTDYDKTTIKATFVMPQNVFQSKAEMGAVGKAVAVQFSHNSASLPLLLNGFSWSKRNLRNV